MTKHTPATPLPWNHASAELSASNKPAVCGIDTGSGFQTAEGWHYVAWAVNGSNDERAERNAAYIAHAANAYPRLVEALRQAAFERECGQNRVGEIKSTERMRALLRELGEDA